MLQSVGHIKCERRLPTLVAADIYAVQPHIRQVIDRAKTQQVPGAWGMGEGGWGRPPSIPHPPSPIPRQSEGVPIPCHPVIIREDLLDYPRNRRQGCFGVAALEPALRTPNIV